MFTKIEDFLTNWQHESGSTQKVLDALTDESLAQEVSPQDRTLGRIAWHIVTTLDEMMGRTGLKFEATPHNAELPNSSREIAEAYRSSSEAMVSAITRTMDRPNSKRGKRDVRANVANRYYTWTYCRPPNTPPRSNHCAHAAGRPYCTGRIWSGKGRMGSIWRTTSGSVILLSRY